MKKLLFLSLLAAFSVHAQTPAPTVPALRPPPPWPPVPMPSQENLARWMTPFWKGDLMPEESLLMWAPEGQRPGAPLLFPATEVVSVQDALLGKTYRPGVDWKYENGSLTLPQGSGIPYLTAAEMYPSQAGPPKSTMKTPGGGFLLFHEGPFFHEHQIVVTYRHAPGVWQGPVPAFDPSLLPKTIARLQAKEPVKIVALGDSITIGANSSGYIKSPPFMPDWVDLTGLWLEHIYKAPVTVVNRAVGGKNAQWGADVADAAFAPEHPDLVIIAFGMNDRPRSVEEYDANIKSIMASARRANPAVEFILVESMLNNPKWGSAGNLAAFGDFLRSLSGPGTAFADMMSMHAALLQHKRYEDMTGNHVNHPNDFLTRAYAQTVAALLVDPGVSP